MQVGRQDIHCEATLTVNELGVEEQVTAQMLQSLQVLTEVQQIFLSSLFLLTMHPQTNYQQLNFLQLRMDFITGEMFHGAHTAILEVDLFT